MTLYEAWITKSYDKDGRSLKKVWDEYIPLEQKIYEQMLSNNSPRVVGKVGELAEENNMPPEFFCGFLDGIKETLTSGEETLDFETLDENTEIDITTDFERLYKKMVEYKADHLYNLPEWDAVFTPENRKEFFTQQKKSGTVVREAEKVGRNDPCPCGSGKKYKHCCGKTA